MGQYLSKILGQFTRNNIQTMDKVRKKSRNKIYWILLVLSIVLGLILYVFLQQQFSFQFLVFFSGLPFFLFVTASFGLLWSKIKPYGEEVYISHALIIGLLFVILFFIHTWIILPHLCPNLDLCFSK
ncbi:hypothetical protein BC962_3049 [Gillisia mitskevichiae]|uniref:Uncharacterized protein n=1 Tax=Gillisia mitskevichiae TaxID=270921 RepID=A0A495P037_9FLAO|nr:hypothetical protein [Gillisia mitskevichiae]RKS42762.1 hypothetical protein BC962_3049 [Gillisia mitskevichiae]